MSQSNDDNDDMTGCYLVILAILIVVGVITEYHNYIWQVFANR